MQILLPWDPLQLLRTYWDIMLKLQCAELCMFSTYQALYEKRQVPKLKQSMEVNLPKKHILCINVHLCKLGKDQYWLILVAEPSWSPWSCNNRLTVLESFPLCGFVILLPLIAASENPISQLHLKRRKNSSLKFIQHPPTPSPPIPKPSLYKGFLNSWNVLPLLNKKTPEERHT